MNHHMFQPPNEMHVVLERVKEHGRYGVMHKTNLPAVELGHH
jgi:hypothetical protein